MTVLAASSEFLRKTNVSLWRTFPACEAPLGRPQPERLRKDRGRSRGGAGPRGHRTDKGAAEEPVTIRSWQIDHQRFRASQLLSNGQIGAILELRMLFQEFLQAGERLMARLSLRIWRALAWPIR